MKIRGLFVLLPFALACSSEPAKSGQAPAAPTPAEETPAEEAAPLTGSCAKEGEKPEIFGAKISAGDRQLTPLTEVAKDPKAFTNKSLLMTAVIRQNCTKRGCWMEIRPVDDRAGQAVTVRFKDYEFFVPLNSRGATVTLDGTVTVNTLTVEEVKHLEEEGATFTNKRPDGTVEQVEVTASGVEMCGRDRSKK